MIACPNCDGLARVGHMCPPEYRERVPHGLGRKIPNSYNRDRFGPCSSCGSSGSVGQPCLRCMHGTHGERRRTRAEGISVDPSLAGGIRLHVADHHDTTHTAYDQLIARRADWDD